MIVPTVGRVVWYCDPRSPVPLAAIVTYVWSDRLVNLAVFNENGHNFGVTSVTLVQPEDDKPEGRYCKWMPFQVGQSQAVKDAQNEVK